MDDVVNRFAKELADAIAAAVAENPQVEACRARAREAGFDMRVTLEAVVGFVNRSNGARGDQDHDAGPAAARAAGVRPDRQRPPVPPLAAHRRDEAPKETVDNN